MPRTALAAGVLALVALAVVAPVQGSHCVSVDGTVFVPQAKDPALRIGSWEVDGGPDTSGVQLSHFLIESPGTDGFTLKATANLVTDCELFYSADFDITFFKQASDGDKVLMRHDQCGDESGQVPEGSDFAIVWLSAPGSPAQSFEYRTCV